MLSIALALLCAMFWGTGDFLGGSAARKVPLYGVVVVSQISGLVLLCAALPALGLTMVPNVIWVGALAGVAGAGGIALLYRGLAVGRMGVISPITAGLGAATPAAWGLLVRGEHPTAIGLAGLALVTVAVVLISLMPDHAPPGAVPEAGLGPFPPGVAEAIGSGVLLGTFVIIIGSLGPNAGFVPLAFSRASAVVVLVAVALSSRQSVRVPRKSMLTVIICGFLDASANVFLLAAMHGALLSVVAVLSSLYPAATVALAAVFDRERLLAVQWCGVVLALAGIALIAA